MSVFGGKADMTIALHMSAYDPKRTCTAPALPEHRSELVRWLSSLRGDDNEAARSHQNCRLSGRVATDGAPQQSAMPVVGFLSGRSLASDSDLVAAFSRALNEAGYVNGQNIAIEFRWADGQLNELPNWRPN